MLSALKKVGFALGRTLVVALHGVVVALHGVIGAATGWFLAKVVIIAVKLGTWAILQSGKEGPSGWAWIDVSDLWTYIPAAVGGVISAVICARAFITFNPFYDLFASQLQALWMAIAGSFYGGFGALIGAFAGMSIGVGIRIVLWVFQIPIGPPADDLIHTIPGVALGAIGFLIGFFMGEEAAMDTDWSDIFSSSGGGYSGGGGGGGSYGGSTYSSPSSSPTSYSSPPVEAPTYNPAFPNGPNGGPAFPSSPPPDWTVAAQQERTRYEDEQRRNEHNKKLWGS